jgi:hypothetical protein
VKATLRPPTPASEMTRPGPQAGPTG